MIKLFVYGTLKKGFSNNARFLSKQKFLGEAKTMPNFRLYRTASFPCMVRDDDGIAIKGEIWEIDEDCLKKLDWFEGHPDLFERQIIEVESHADWQDDSVQAYLFRDLSEVRGCRPIGDCWE